MNDVKGTVPPTTPAPLPPAVAGEEVLIADARAGLSPSQLVERKLLSLLRTAPLPVSQLQASCLTRR